MSAKENIGLTLEDLSQRLEALERENERMRSENAELRDEVSALRDSGKRWGKVPALRGSDSKRDKEAAPAFEGQVSRRAMLSKAGAAAVAAVAAGTLLNPRPASADHSRQNINANFINAHKIHVEHRIDDTVLSAVAETNSLNATAVAAFNFGRGAAGFFHGGDAGIVALGDSGVRARGIAANSAAVVAVHNTQTVGPGVFAEGVGFGNDQAGVVGRNPGGTGVWGDGSTQAEVAGVRGTGKTGMWGSSTATGYSGVFGQHTGTAGYGVVGEGTGHNGAGVIGRNSSGYGGQFEGGKAQLWLRPPSSAGKPTSGAHEKGEIYLDSAGELFVCTTSGTPGTWNKINTKPAP